MKIGCQDHTIKDWLAYNDTVISLMDNKALKFWKEWKPVIQSILSNRKQEDGITDD